MKERIKQELGSVGQVPTRLPLARCQRDKSEDKIRRLNRWLEAIGLGSEEEISQMQKIPEKIPEK